MNDQYDAIVCGTGLIECVLSGLLSTSGYKVLHIDRNPYYGGESASLNLEQLYEKFGRPLPPPDHLGKSHLYNVDLIPKVLMSAGELVSILRKTVVDRYSMEFMLIENSFVFKSNKINKVPATETEGATSSLMGFFEKRHFIKFVTYIAEFDEADPKTHKGHNLYTMKTADLFKAFSLGNDTIDFVLHAVALFPSDSFLAAPAIDTVRRCRLYADSMEMYGQSPYVYPLYGSGELPQAFSRLSAVYGGTYMLSTPVTKVNFTPEGAFESIESGDQVARAKFIVGDPSYFSDRVTKVGQVVRCICILQNSMQLPKGYDSNSCQIIIPQKETRRNSDIYILQLSGQNKVCPDGKFICIIGTSVENPSNPELDIAPGLALLGANNVLDKFVNVSDIFQPNEPGTESRCFISNSYDAATHFESAAANILDLFQRIHGQPYRYDTIVPNSEEGQEEMK